uniref:Uncharacterized protein n=1 Tax=Trichobilharzia regenti TaxID=157069 RepID=A0AA85KFK6_TRIRE|nr:unnamed protein product [Trichobilharzia regenti]
MASASTSICLLITAFFLCSCESANVKLQRNETTEMEEMLNDAEYEIFGDVRIAVERIIKSYDDAILINENLTKQYESDIKAQVKLVRKVIKNRRRLRRFQECQESYTAARSLLDAYNYLFEEMKRLKYQYISFAVNTDNQIYEAEHLIHKYTKILKKTRYGPRNKGCNAFLTPTEIQDERVKRLVDLISKVHAEQAAYLKNTSLKTVFRGFLDGIQIAEKAPIY